MLFLTGGRPEMLFEKLAPFKDALQSFHGTIVGISAGALVLGPQYLATKDEDYPETILLPGLGIVPAIPSVHYSNADDPEILPFSQEHEILAIPDNAALEIRDTAMTPHGEVTVFSRDGKRRFEKAHKKSP
jgi:peptidase E